MSTQAFKEFLLLLSGQKREDLVIEDVNLKRK
jgi:hypothetical protein